MEKYSKKLSRCLGFLYYPSKTESPDMCGFLFSNPLVGREVFNYIISKRIDEYVKVVFKIFKANKIGIRISDSQDRLIIYANDVYANDAVIRALKEAYSTHPNYSIGFGIYHNDNGLKIFPISRESVVITIRGFEVNNI